MQHIKNNEISSCLALKLSYVKETKEEYAFPEQAVNLPKDCDVVFVHDVCNIFASLENFLKKDKKIVFFVEDVSRCKAFIEKDLLPEKNVYFAYYDIFECDLVAQKFLFQRPHFLGDLALFQSSWQKEHMRMSIFQNFGKEHIEDMFANFLEAKSIIDGRSLKGSYANKSAVIVGMGPSLKENLEDLKSIQGKTHIIAVGSAIGFLLEQGIGIDLAVAVDPLYTMPACNQTFPLFFQARVSPKLFSTHKGPKVWMGSSAMFSLEEWFLQKMKLGPWVLDAGWNVSNLALQVTHLLGFSEVTLWGIDGGDKNDRPLQAGEWLENNWITRADLFHGIRWIEEFIQEDSNTKYFRKGEGLSIGGLSKKEPEDFPKKTWEEYPVFYVNHQQVLGFLKSFQIIPLLEKIQDFILCVERSQTVCHKQKTFLEMELLESPFFTYHLEPLFQIFQPLIEREKKPQNDSEQFLSKVLFLQSVLLTFQHLYQDTPEGAYFCGEKEGVFLTESPKKSKRSFRKGQLDGRLAIFDKEGYLQREGFYTKGKKVGRHRVYKNVKQLLFSGFFVQDMPVGIHKWIDLDNNQQEIDYSKS